MADTSVAITAGTGTAIDTRTESTNGNHRQVVVLGDPATNAGVAPVDATNGLAVDIKQSVTLTETNSTAILADTASMDTNLTTLAGAVSGTEVQVDVLSSALPSGASTAANQSTIIGHVDGIEGLLTTIDADTGSVATDASTIAGDTTSLDTKIASDTTDDLDSGAGTDTVKVQGLAVPASGGHAVVTGDTTNGLDVDVTRVSGTVTVDGSGVTQPVSGTVTANLSTTDNAVLDDIAANQTDASQKTQIVDGAGNVIGSTSNALDVNIASGSSSGTEYTEDAAAPANPAAPALSLVRDDVLSGQTTADGDIVTARGTDKGEIYVKHADDITIADGGNSITVDGTVAAAQSGTWNVNNVSGTVSLPTGASTAANQTTIIGHVDGIEGLLGTIDTDTGNIATNTSTTAAGFATEGSALGSGVLLQGDDGTDRKNINVHATTGDVQVDVTNTVTVDGSGVTQPVSASSLPLPTGASTAANQTTIIGHVDGIEGLLTTIDADTGTLASAVSGTEVQVDVVGSLPAGTNTIGKLGANSGVDIGDVDVTSISAGSNLIGDVGIQGRTTGGLSTYYDSDLDETKVAVKATAGTIYAIEAFNTTAAPLFLQLFNVASGSVTVGATTPTNQWVIPGNADSDGAGFTFNVPQGIAYGTAITAACTTDSEGSTAPGAGACIVNIHYK